MLVVVHWDLVVELEEDFLLVKDFLVHSKRLY